MDGRNIAGAGGSPGADSLPGTDSSPGADSLPGTGSLPDADGLPGTVSSPGAGILRGAGALAGAAAGALVGAIDGLRAAVLVGAGVSASLKAALLASGIDLLIGALAGTGAELLARLVVWGRGATTPRRYQLPGWVLGAAAAAVAAYGTLLVTALRNNRFLAAGLVSLSALGAAVLALALAPALARVIAGRRAQSCAVGPSSRSSGLAILLVPLVGAVVLGILFVVVWRTRAPLAGRVLAARARWVMLTSAILPCAMMAAVLVRSGLSRRFAASIAGLAVGAGAVGLLIWGWQDHLRFVPWADVVVAASIVVAAVAAVAVLGPRVRWRPARVLATVLVLVVAAAGAVFWCAESEAARKVLAMRAGLAPQILATARLALDRDRDGYARWLGGGDCDDGDPSVFPGALEIVGNDIDEDCDGRDLVADGLVSPPFATVPDSVPRDLNIIFISIDTLRADHLSCYGYPRPTSPVLDRLAAEGTLFENGWAHAPSTRYSMPAIVTGRWPSAIAWDESIWWPRIARGVRTLGEAMHDLGYVTGGLFSFDYFDPRFRRGFERGMDTYSAERGRLHVSVNGPMESRGSSSREMADDAIAFVDRNADRKFFLWVHFYDPHLSYEEHAEVPSFGADRVARYDGEIRFTDLHVGRLLEHLRSAGLWDRTAIFVTGDHGEGMGEHGVTEHGFHLYGPQTKVPFIVRVPGLPAHRDPTPVGHVDLAPTMVNLARGPHEESFLGRSMVDVLAGARRAEPEPVFQEVSSERGKRRALVSADHHLIWNWVPDNTTECYDLASDPTEQRDLWGMVDGGPCLELSKRLRQTVAMLSLPGDTKQKLAFGLIPVGAAAPPPAVRIDARLGDAVRVLGYDLDPVVARAGGEVKLTIHFEALRRLPPGWRVFVHAEGAGGFRNLDHVPVEGALPVERWKPGQRIRDRIKIPVTAPGPMTVWLGMWRGTERLPVSAGALSDGKNRLKLATIAVH